MSDDRLDQIRELAQWAEQEYVRALNAILACPGGMDPGQRADYWRWQGHAERLRQVATRLRDAAGDPVPEYGSQKWRDAHGVYTDEQVQEFRRMHRTDHQETTA